MVRGLSRRGFPLECRCGTSAVVSMQFVATDQDWMDEIRLDPGSPWLQMGTRQLGARPWLIFDEKRLGELALKHRLLADITDDVLIEPKHAEAAGQEALQLVEASVEAAGHTLDQRQQLDELIQAGFVDSARGPQTASDVENGASPMTPLDRAGRIVQEDLCLLERSSDGWLLQAASLCFPSRWRLRDKIGRPLGEVHGPVPGYEDVLRSRVDGLLDRLKDQVVWRRNWFIHPNSDLYQPEYPEHGDPLVASDRCGEALFLRSERQTLRRLPKSQWVLFTLSLIHI